MKTSNFVKAGANPLAVAIARGVPRGYKGRRYMPLAPSWALIKITDEKLYTKRYKTEVLDKLDPQSVYTDLGPDTILLCWEPPGQFCHRRLVATWLEDALGIKIDELE